MNFIHIFLQKCGMFDIEDPWDDARVTGFLSNTAAILSRDYATPWASFDAVPDRFKYPVTVYAALEFWWAKAGEYASKFDIQVGGSTGQRSTQLFYRALEMIDYLQKEFDEVSRDLMDEDSSGNILVGDLVRRDKFTGRLVPNRNDPAGDWMS